MASVDVLLCSSFLNLSFLKPFKQSNRNYHLHPFFFLQSDSGMEQAAGEAQWRRPRDKLVSLKGGSGELKEHHLLVESLENRIPLIAGCQGAGLARRHWGHWTVGLLRPQSPQRGPGYRFTLLLLEKPNAFNGLCPHVILPEDPGELPCWLSDSRWRRVCAFVCAFMYVCVCYCLCIIP